ncbi:hypothetical protein IG631_20620 [Alternaria alternata]|nr:hypothetical protein IG631_20620 [Alternaria alternata]
MRRTAHNYGPDASLFAFATPGVMYGRAGRFSAMQHLPDAPHARCCHHHDSAKPFISTIIIKHA